MNYARYPLIYGLFSGGVVAAVIVVGILFKDRFDYATSLWFGYLAMLVSLTFLFVGVKRYRDVEKGGVIKFFPAFGMGLAIALVAAVAYACVWEIYLAASNYAYMDTFIAEEMRQLHARGASAAEIAKMSQDFEWMRGVYRNPPARFAMTMAEILPVGIGVALVSAAVLRFPKVLPAR